MSRRPHALVSGLDAMVSSGFYRRLLGDSAKAIENNPSYNDEPLKMTQTILEAIRVKAENLCEGFNTRRIL